MEMEMESDVCNQLASYSRVYSSLPHLNERKIYLLDRGFVRN